MKQINVTIKGISPLLMRRFPLIQIDGLDKMKPEEQAEHSAYRSNNGTLMIPGVNMQRTLVSAATYQTKGKNSIQKKVAATVFVEEAEILLGLRDYQVDSRAVVIAATKGRIIRHRPRIDQWQASFTLSYDETLLSEKQVNQLLLDAGTKVGILDFRPERKGPFGRFIVTHFEPAS